FLIEPEPAIPQRVHHVVKTIARRAVLPFTMNLHSVALLLAPHNGASAANCNQRVRCHALVYLVSKRERINRNFRSRDSSKSDSGIELRFFFCGRPDTKRGF